MTDPLRARLRRAPRVFIALAARRLRPVIVASLGGALVLGAALAQRLPAALRRRRGLRPRIVWGPVPLISISYWSRALQRLGFESQTVVTHHYAAYERASFDTYRRRGACGAASRRRLATTC